jgi:magnesium chelatase subunit I
VADLSAVPGRNSPPATSTAHEAGQPPPAVSTLGDLRGHGHRHRSVKSELRENLLARMAAGAGRFPGIVGYDETVLPQVERALLAGHDIIFLGERGQGKTRLMRTLTTLLDEWSPAIAGCEMNDHPYQPACGPCRRLVAQEGDATPVVWRHRDDRYGEKLATRDVKEADLIGDIDSGKVVTGHSLSDEATIHYGLMPRSNRGVFAVNELPDLNVRIQVALFNVLEERDVQVRGYRLRLPMDILLVASANPEDYTHRGRIVTPLKDRFGAEIRTHYPHRLADEIRLARQESVLAWDDSVYGAPVMPDHLVEAVARFTRLVREAPQVDQRSGVSLRLVVSATETVTASAVRRAALTGEDAPVARVVDLATIVPAVRGKVEFDQLEEGREEEILAHLLRRAVADTFRARLAGTDLSGLQRRFSADGPVETGDLVPASELLKRVGRVDGLGAILTRLGIDAAESPGLAAAALEFALEGLYLNRRLSKEELPGRTVYHS